MTQKHIIKDDEFSREYWMHFPPLLSFSSSLSPFIYYLYINMRVYVFWINVTCSFVRHRSFNDTIRYDCIIVVIEAVSFFLRE